MLEFDNAVEFVKQVKRDHEIEIIECALLRMQVGVVENLKIRYLCRDAGILNLAIKIYEEANK